MDGYLYAAASAGGITFTVTADPQNTNTGTRYFFSDESGVIRYTTGGTADVNDLPLGQ
jgi:hypothetical protein